MNTLILAAALSEATLLRMAPMAVEPTVDNVIAPAEERAASTHYGLVSHGNGLMATRYNVAHFGYTAKGFYFAVRSSVPEAPQTLTDEDAITLTLLPPGAEKPLVFTKKVRDGRQLKGVKDYGVLCAETEMFVPYSATLPKPKDGEKWGLNMTLDYSSERETASWHWKGGKVEGELGTLIIDSKAPIVSLVKFGMIEHWRATANFKFQFRFVNPMAKDVKISSDSRIFRGIGFSKLNSEAEENLAKETRQIADFDGLVLAAKEKKEIYHTEYSIWSGTVACLDLDLKADGETVYRRKYAWDISRGNKWKAEQMPILECKFFPSYGNHLSLQNTANGLNDLVRGKIELRGVRAGKTYWTKELKTPSELKYGFYDLSFPELPEDNYEVTLATETAAGKTYRHTRTFEITKFEWQGNDVGKQRVIVPPFKPIKVENQTISFLQTGYRCSGVLWDALYGKGENILAAPVTLKLNGQEFQVKNVEYKEISDDRVVREVKAEIPLSTSTSSLHLTVTQDYDYDGFCWTTFAFDAKDPVEVKSLMLAVPLKNKLVRFVDHMNRGDTHAGPASDVSVPEGGGVIWDSTTVLKGKEPSAWEKSHRPAKIHSYLYIGGVFKGLAWLMDSVRDLSLTWEKSPQRLVRNGDTLTYEFDLVAKPTVWKGAKRISMGFLPTPVKPKDPTHGKFGEILYSYPCPSNSIMYAYSPDRTMTPMLSDHSNIYPNDDQTLISYIRAAKTPNAKAYHKFLDDYVARNREWLDNSPITSSSAYRDAHNSGFRDMCGGLRPRYFDPLVITCFWPEWEMYKGEWYPWEWMRENYFNEYHANLCPSRIDKLLWEGRVALGNGAHGLYYDCFYSFASCCYPQGDAYLREDKTIQWSLTTVRYWREILKRSAVLCYLMGKTYHGRPVVELHDTAGALPMLDSWCLTGLSTERGLDGGEFPIRFPESFSLVNVVGANSGKGSHFIVSCKNGDLERRNRELMSLVSYMCAYGIFAIEDQGLVGGNQRFYKAWNIPFDYGWGEPEVEQFTYWDEEKTMPVEVRRKKEEGRSGSGRSGETKVRVSVGKKKDSALVMFGSLGADPETITFDLAGLGFGPGAKVTDAETGKPFDGNTLTLGRFGYKMLFVNRSGK